MAIDFARIEGDYCYVDVPIEREDGACVGYRSKMIMTKKAFQKCYKEWILEDKEQTDGTNNRT